MIGLAVMGIGLAAARAGGLECAVDSALQGTETALEWAKHKFLIQPVEMTEKDKRQHVLSGSVLYVNGKKDETVAYRITKHGGTVKGIELQVNSGMWLSLSPEMTKALGEYRTTGNVEKEKQEAIRRALYKAGEGSWMKTVELIVAFVAIKHC